MEAIEHSFQDAVERLKEALDEEKTVLVRDAAIKRFELAAELSWKVLQKRLRNEGIQCNSPRGCYKDAFKAKILSDDFGWELLLKDRNLSVHTYDEALAEDLYGRLRAHCILLQSLADFLSG